MRILQVGATYSGAQEKIQYSIHRFLQSHGEDSYILYAYGESNDINIIRYESRVAKILRRFIHKYITRSPHCAFLSTFQLINNINKIKPDIVHLHVLHHGYIDYLWLFRYLAKKKIPVVYTMHDMWVFTGGCYYYNDVKCNGYRSGCENCPQSIYALDCNINRTAHYLNAKSNLYDKLNKIMFVAVSDWVLNEAKKSLIYKYPMHTIWNALDSDIFREKKTFKHEKHESIQFSDESFKIIGVANTWIKRKGIHKFIELAKILGDKYQIILVGNAGKEIQLNSPSNILYVGMIKDKMELASYYKKADIHISMSLEETFGYTFVEAAFSGTKSIGYDSTAIPSVLRMVKGFVIQEHSVLAVANQVKKLHANRGLCKLTSAEIEEIYKKFSPDKMAGEYYKIYSNLLSDGALV